jgi:hypothetical protein
MLQVGEIEAEESQKRQKVVTCTDFAFFVCACHMNVHH